MSLLPPDPIVQPPSKLGTFGTGAAGFVVSPHPARRAARVKVLSDRRLRMVALSPPVADVGRSEDA